MQYYIIDTTIYDGEYEYFTQSPVSAKNEKAALKLAGDEAKEWTQDDYREYSVNIHSKITKEEYEIISKYIY